MESHWGVIDGGMIRFGFLKEHSSYSVKEGWRGQEDAGGPVRSLLQSPGVRL